MKLPTAEVQQLVSRALQAAGAGRHMADSTAHALVMAEAQGQAGHGLSRVAQYSTHLRNGRAVGSAVPSILQRKGSALVIDAGEGLAFPACDLAIREAINTAREQGVAVAGVVRSHHCGVVVDHLRAVAEAGMVGLGFANSPAAMPAADAEVRRAAAVDPHAVAVVAPGPVLAAVDQGVLSHQFDAVVGVDATVAVAEAAAVAADGLFGARRQRPQQQRSADDGRDRPCEQGSGHRGPPRCADPGARVARRCGGQGAPPPPRGGHPSPRAVQTAPKS